MRTLLLGLLAVVSLSAAQKPQTFTGIITDSECADGNHARMRMGANDAECVNACIRAHGAEYVLYTGGAAYVLSDQKAPEAFAAEKVTVTGTLDPATKRIQVQSITAAK